jgi:uncharacterized protein YyaL (SSP411 family)
MVWVALLGCEHQTRAQEPAAPPDPALPGVTATAPLVAELAEALRRKGPQYRPRARHLTAGNTPLYTNRLIRESSPYLLQHAHNPVNWFPWENEALARARALQRPIFLSVGYSTCHWCHVMERESFEDLEVAAFLNANFVPIKVDRETRPDVDAVYMAAVQSMTGSGGWPMTVVLTPEGLPFFGGTYFPPRDGERGGRKGLLTILRELAQQFHATPQEVVTLAARLSSALGAAADPGPGDSIPDESIINVAVALLAQQFDPVDGGFGRPPKFPRPVNLELLLRHHHRTGSTRSRDMVAQTLDAMARGGIHDHVGGGFHRYSTDRRWLVPHFEKMLYDNAQLAVIYLEAWQLTKQPDLAKVAGDVLEYVRREMTDPGGGFYSATDADSLAPDGSEHEGWFYTWTPTELVAVLGRARADIAGAWFNVSEKGDLNGRSVIHTQVSKEVGARRAGVPVEVFERDVAAVGQALLQARQGRRAPHLDDKVLAGWNGLMISAFARGGFVLGREDYVGAAVQASRFILTSMQRSNGQLARAYRHGLVEGFGFLEDYALVIQGLLDVHEATGDATWIREAVRLQAVQDQHFHNDVHGGYFQTAGTHEKLITRPRPMYDGAEPSGNSVSVLNLLRLSEWTGRGDLRQRAETTLAAFGTSLRQTSVASPMMLCGLDFLLGRPKQVAIVLPAGASRGQKDVLTEVVRGMYLPNRVLTVLEERAIENAADVIPWLVGKRALGGVATAYVCEHGRCELPATDPRTLAQQLKPLRKEAH